MKIGLLKETKFPTDNRVALTPKQARYLKDKYPNCDIVVESCDSRAYSDDEYVAEGIKVVTNLDDCDVLFGIKEVKIDSLIPNKHYFFFGHVAKQQAYNRPLLQAMMAKGITFSDYEYLVDENNQRVCAFGWWAGIVGVYYTLRGYLLRKGDMSLPKPDKSFTKGRMIELLQSVNFDSVKILITGDGRVSQGAQYILNEIRAKQLNEDEFMSDKRIEGLSYFVAPLDKLVYPKSGQAPFDEKSFFAHPEEYESNFLNYGCKADVYLSCHFWNPLAPVYLCAEDLRNPNLHLQVIGDITCDIKGSVMSTLRSSTHDNPYYDYNPETEKEEPPFSSTNNISVMAVDTCPNALALDSSNYFGERLIECVFNDWLATGAPNDIVSRSTILQNGSLTERFSYLTHFASQYNNKELRLINISFDELRQNDFSRFSDAEGIFSSGLELYRNALLDNPYTDDSSTACVLAVVDDLIVGRHMMLNTKLKVGDEIIDIKTGGGGLVSSKCRGMGIGSRMINLAFELEESDLYYGALYSRAAYDIIRKKGGMLEIPQYVKIIHKGIKRVLDLPVIVKSAILKRRYTIERLTSVPQWAGEMAMNDSHKYMEVHTTEWLQWALDSIATGVPTDFNQFHAVYDKNHEPVGFFMTKVRTVTKNGETFSKANLAEWATSATSQLNEVDINILAIETVSSLVSRFWTITEKSSIGKALLRHGFKRRGWLAMHVRDKKHQFSDISDVSQWRIRYGCCNTMLVD